MSTPSSGPDAPATEREFDRQLGELIRRATHNGVDVEGGWAYRTDDQDAPDLGVEIYAVVRSEMQS